VYPHRLKIRYVRNPELHTKVRSIRLDDDLWDGLEAVAGKRGRTVVIRDLVRWYLRRPGARLPQRPGD
jgi:predicted DNA-binding ribbon-helix-helix protein